MKKKKGFAKIEFTANLDKIRNLSSKGFNKKAIYDLLCEEGKITMSYQNFCAYDLNGVRQKTQNSSSPGVPANRVVSATHALPVNCDGDGSTQNMSASGSSFTHKKKVTDEDLDQIVG